ncbi:hypothetical protein ACQKDD_11700 [Planococcus kocurii]|uniref:hypothetical protein n=1 Tax=Planococcus kocurii TaxID=1374 RepID=UPI003D021C1D
MDIQAKLFLNTQNDIEIIPYDYLQNGYRKVLEDSYEKNLRQIIFTTSLYKQVIEKIYEENMLLLKINFMDCLDEQDFTDIKELVSQSNISSGKSTYISILLKEIERFANHESIDIKSIIVFDKETKQKVEVYNNGVILGEKNQIEKINSNIFVGLKD